MSFRSGSMSIGGDTWKPRCVEDTVDSGVHPAVAAMRLNGGEVPKLQLSQLGKLGFTQDGLGPKLKAPCLQSPPRKVKKSKKDKKKEKRKENEKKKSKKRESSGSDSESSSSEDKKKKKKKSKKKEKKKDSSSSDESKPKKKDKTKRDKKPAAIESALAASSTGVTVATDDVMAAAATVCSSSEEVESQPQDDSMPKTKKQRLNPPDGDESASSEAEDAPAPAASAAPSAAGRAAAAFEAMEAEATQILDRLERRDATALEGAVRILVGGTPERQESVACAIAGMTPSSVDRDGTSKMAVNRAGAIPPLITLLRSPNPGVQKQAARALHNITGKSKENKAAVASAGAIPYLAELLKSGPVAARDQAIGVLRNLTGGIAENKASVIATGCASSLVATLRSIDCPPEVQVNVCVVIYNITNDNADRRTVMADAGAIEPLVTLMKDGTLEVRREAADALRVLSIGSAKNCAATISAGGAPAIAMLVKAGAPKQAIALKDHLIKYGGQGVRLAVAAEVC
eukprot:TRINITY_DN62133_c0_g1_i1.p1 TRINITY_DN62133_c0_g1~~TRINITY_DN62133_c0_g1_i1.p1  ORF type:complete len:515 (+),score=130.36 TRINITY_DN62133_c0_g1_i1:163-1707(+)